MQNMELLPMMCKVLHVLKIVRLEGLIWQQFKIYLIGQIMEGRQLLTNYHFEK